MRRSGCAILAGLLILAVIVAVVVIFSRVAGNGELPDRQETMSALVATNADVLMDTGPTLTVLAVTFNAPLPTDAPGEATLPPAGQMMIYLVVPEGSTGPVGPVGCNNYLLPVARGPYQPTTTDEQIAYALLDLFSIKDQFYGESRLYNALYQSTLSLDSVTVDDTGQATIKLSGQLLLDGECTAPLVQAQIEQTVRQFGVPSLTITLNGQPLADALSGRGT